ncbi:hypothetical protein ACFSMW_19275 [Virgibacillus halophilus]|uniref:hypothetical protein n=1 Tax=Tigheibacillus halophilus TaxID=361280 RepID=UPI003632C3F8
MKPGWILSCWTLPLLAEVSFLFGIISYRLLPGRIKYAARIWMGEEVFIPTVN